MKMNFIEIRDREGNSTNRRFSNSQQDLILKAIIRHIIIAIKKFSTLNAETIKDEVFSELSRIHQQYIAVLEGSIFCSPETDLDKVKKNSQHFYDILNSFSVNGSFNSLWNFALIKLESYGIFLSDRGEFEKRLIETKLNFVHKAVYFGYEDDTQIKFEFDNPFKKEVRNEISLEMTLILMSITDGELYDETIPPSLTLIRGTDADLEFNQVGLYIKHTYLKSKEFNLLPLNLNTEYLVKIGSTKYRAKILKKITEKNLEIILSDRNRLSEIKKGTDRFFSHESSILHFREIPNLEDYLVSLELYERKTKLLKPSKLSFGSYVTVNFDFLIHKAITVYSYLNARSPNGYNAAEKFIRTNDANLVELGKTILSSSLNIKNEFEKIMQLDFRKVTYFKFQNRNKTFIKIPRYNGVGLIDELINSWRISQLSSPIFSKNPNGEVLINKVLAKILWNDYLKIEKMVDVYSQNEHTFIKNMKDYSIIKRNELDNLRKSQSDILFKAWYDLFVKTLFANGIQIDGEAIKDLIINDCEFQESIYAGYSLHKHFGRTESNKPTGILSAIIMKLNFGDSKSDLVHREKNGFLNLFQADNPLYTENTAFKIIANAQSRYSKSLIINSV